MQQVRALFTSGLLILVPLYEAQAQSITQICNDREATGVELGTCLVDQASKQASDLQGMMCSDSRCYMRVSCSGEYEQKVCKGEGYKITFKAEEWGYSTLVRGPDKRPSVFGRCGTCYSFDYASGPITEMELIRLRDTEDMYFSFSPAN